MHDSTIFIYNPFGEKLSPNPCRGEGHPENGNHYAIFFFLLACLNICTSLLGGPILRRHLDTKKTARLTMEVVFAYVDDSRIGSPDRQTNLIHLEAFFPPWLSMTWTSIWINVFLQFQPWKFSVTRFQR
jgi:hypothetical protein